MRGIPRVDDRRRLHLLRYLRDFHFRREFRLTWDSCGVMRSGQSCADRPGRYAAVAVHSA